MSENKRKSSQLCLFPQPSNLKWRWVLTVDLRIYLKSILLEFRFFRLASFFWISPEKCKIRFWQLRAAPWPRDIVGFPAPLLIFKLSLQVGTRSTKHACARFWKFSFFSSRKTRARQHEKKRREISSPPSPQSLVFLAQYPSYFASLPFIWSSLEKASELWVPAWQTRFLEKEDDTRASFSLTPLFIARHASALPPPPPWGTGAPSSQNSRQKKNHNEIGARAEDLYKQTTVCPYERVFHVVFVRCTKDTRNVAERNYRSKSWRFIRPC